MIFIKTKRWENIDINSIQKFKHIIFFSSDTIQYDCIKELEYKYTLNMCMCVCVCLL